MESNSWVTIVDKSNPQNGTTSDFDGSFLSLESKEFKGLQFSSIGFKTKVVAIEGSFINITLEEEQNK
jgi:hypothetical protein